MREPKGECGGAPSSGQFWENMQIYEWDGLTRHIYGYIYIFCLFINGRFVVDCNELI